LLSAFGDIGGFVHDDLDRSPAAMYEHPMFTTTETIDYAGQRPNVIVRSGRPPDGEAALAYSEDGGHSWQPVAISRPSNQSTRRRRRASPAIIVSADGTAFMVMTDPPMITRDRAKTWTEVKGLPPGARPIADRVDPLRVFAIDFASGKIYTSSDAGVTFVALDTKGLPDNIKPDAPTWSEAPWPLLATIGRKGDLWFVSKSALFHSTDGGAHFEKTGGDLQIDSISFGKAPPGRDFPALFAIGTKDQLKAIWRSDDVGRSWIRINDDAHQYGTRFRCISGDPRLFGRVYVGTDGRGILYADPRF
jgi:hypothetical protein